MSRSIATAAVAALAIAGLALFAATRAPARPPLGPSPVVVELFTSQGCSSCPPADALVAKLAHDPELRGRVLPLAYHVDYWDHLGWRDPYSSHLWTVRQTAYVQAMSLASAYTPQIVVNGSRDMVGSNSAAVQRAIEEESRRASPVKVTLTREGNVVHAAATRTPDAELLLAFYESEPATNVTDGENRGRALVNENVVRQLVSIPSFDDRVPVPPGMEVVAFVQEKKTRRIVAAAAASTVASRP